MQNQSQEIIPLDCIVARVENEHLITEAKTAFQGKD